MFERRSELDGLLRTHLYTELAEHTTTQIVPVFYQHFFLLSSFIGDKFGRDFDSSRSGSSFRKSHRRYIYGGSAHREALPVRPGNGPNIFSVARFSGYCSVVFLVKNSRIVTFIPVSNDKSPLKNEVIYLIILFIVPSLKM